MEIFRRNSTLESFLTRKLPHKIFASIRYYESCVVKYGSEPLSLKFLILTDETLYFTENPPKTIHGAVKLTDITNIALIHEHPEFEVSGTDRGNYQQIYLQHRHNGLDDSPKNNNNNKSSEKGDLQPSSIILGSNYGKSKPTRNGVPRTLILEEKENESTPSPVQSTPTLSRPSSVLSFVLERIGAFSGGMMPLPLFPARSHTPDPSPGYPLLGRSASVMEQPRRNSFTSRSQSAMSGLTTMGLTPWDTVNERSISNVDSSSNRTVSSAIHVYVIRPNSPTFTYLQNSWIASLINATVLLQRKSSELSSIVNSGTSQHLEMLYEQFKRDIQNPRNTVEQTYELLLQLQEGAKKNYAIKLLFWKDQSAYHFLVSLLHQLLLGRLNPPRTTEELLSTRADHLETAVLVLNTLQLMFANTDTLHAKLQMLRYNRGSIIHHLLSVLFTTPHVPTPFRNICHRMLDNHYEFVSTACKNLPEYELIKLLAEMVNSRTAVIYEVFLTIQNLMQVYRDGYWSFSKLMTGIKLDRYLTWSATQVFSYLFPLKNKQLSPSEAVLVYQQLYVFKILVETFGTAEEHLRNHFQEEFKYYIQKKSVSARIPDNYPIKGKIILLAENLAKVVVIQ